MCEYTAKDFKKGQPRWCPGCGDHFFLASLHKAMAEIGVPPYKTAVISGIGCSSRLPHYMNTYGMNTIHGRAAAIATGCKVANPELTVWQVSGDGDGLAIGGNHFIHANRRNINLNMILLNNRIYGLTKGQYSPTSPRGFVSKSSPYGTVEDPFHPAELCFGARGHFFARAVATDAAGTVEILKAAYNHKGASVCEFQTTGRRFRYWGEEFLFKETRHAERFHTFATDPLPICCNTPGGSCNALRANLLRRMFSR